MAASKKQIKDIEIPTPTIASMRVRFTGDRLVLNPMNAKLPGELEDQQTGKIETTKRKGKRAPLDPKHEFNKRRIRDKKGRDLLDTFWVKAMLGTAASDIEGISRKDIKRLVQVRGDVMHDGRSMAVINHKKLQTRTDVVRVGAWNNKEPMMRYRPEYLDWYVDLTIEYDADLVRPEQILALLLRAGLYVGLCELRPEQGFDCGRFTVSQLQAKRTNKTRKAA